MNKDKIIDKLLIFMQKEISKDGNSLNQVQFNFSFSETRRYFNAPDEIIPDGEDLAAFKKFLNKHDNDLIKRILNKSLTEGYIGTYSSEKYSYLILTELGLGRAKSTVANKKNKLNKGLSYFFDKFIITIIVSALTTFTTVLITNYFANKNFNAEINNIKKDIQWIKEQK